MDSRGVEGIIIVGHTISGIEHLQPNHLGIGKILKKPAPAQGTPRLGPIATR
uniref:Uncharacterized protein n=1 Tax=Candidatus Kentrum sp. SD TaxID=2126332 RepID=A0A450YFB3_9GAMM|nr:MAG: hypothetical protein BECKSD772F_GA0070984_105517 [Candidatus Kentron sp. SD]VFK45501.1 MAG: hypothetical protein BECKSD772E_GA0070983_10552 [Candidatus Kentron sp. SD]